METVHIPYNDNVWYLGDYYNESGEKILPEPLEMEYRSYEKAKRVETMEFSDLSRPQMLRSEERFTGKLTPLKLC